MSVELPEARILAGQMNETLLGKRIKSYHLQHVENLQRIGFMNKDVKPFDQLVNGKIEAVVSRGNVIHVKLDRGMNLILAPEYGGRILYHADNDAVQKEYHLKVDFSDGTVLTVRLTGMGGIYALKDDELGRCYMYRRDFSEVLSPADEKVFTFERFSKLLASKNTSLKSVLVGKDAVVVGLGNTTFQDILYRAKIYPKRKANELNENAKQALYDAIKLVLQERTRLGGKKQFVDLYGKQGKYTSAMGSNIKTCTECGTPIEKLSLGGGQTHFCPKCQKR
jgi:formamidopyrimidine-DNA glycosylase